MRARVQYATTADDVRIAFSTDGTGTPLVYMPPIPLRHVELEWHLPEDRRWLERIGRGRRLIRYDPRGLGLSERHAADWSLDGLVRDLAAVVDAAVDTGMDATSAAVDDATSTERVALFACVNTAPIALAYAVRHPERVSHLLLWCAVARMADALSPQMLTLFDLAERDWQLFTEAMANQMVGWSTGEPAHRYAEFLRACVTPESGRALVAGLRAADVTDLLPQVRTPTLVVHRRGVSSVPVARATELAARIPGARLAILDGDVMRPGAGDVEAAAHAVDQFLGDASRDVTPATAPTGNVFRREGEYWTLIFDGAVCRVRDAKGLHHILRLLRDPGLQFAPAELLAELEPPPPSSAEHARGADLHAAALGDAGPVLDAKAKLVYRSRLTDLREELADAERSHDPARAGAARTEIEFLARELSAAVGLGGRDRKSSSAAERARLTVTKRIKDALGRIRASHPALARHLDATIKTGSLCAYGLDPADRVAWSL
ncbi:MAG: alpha/beta hydrolase [Candidatus Binatia bacterium]